MATKQARPAWLKGVQKTGSSSALVSVQRQDGSMVTYRMPRTSLRQAAAEQDRKVKQRT